MPGLVRWHSGVINTLCLGDEGPVLNSGVDGAVENSSSSLGLATLARAPESSDWAASSGSGLTTYSRASMNSGVSILPSFLWLVAPGVFLFFVDGASCCWTARLIPKPEAEGVSAGSVPVRATPELAPSPDVIDASERPPTDRSCPLLAFLSSWPWEPPSAICSSTRVEELLTRKVEDRLRLNNENDRVCFTSAAPSKRPWGSGAGDSVPCGSDVCSLITEPDLLSCENRSRAAFLR